MSIVNLQRDATFHAPEKTRQSFGTETTWADATAQLVDADATVYDEYAAESSGVGAIAITAANKARTYGVYIRPPGKELTPYRVKAYASSDDAALSFRIMIGYAEGTIDGDDDAITHWSSFPFEKYFDELFLIEPSVTVDDHPIFFGVTARGITTGAQIDSHISVQNLSTSPPQFSQSVS